MASGVLGNRKNELERTASGCGLSSCACVDPYRVCVLSRICTVCWTEFLLINAFFVAVLHTDPWLCLATGLRFFCGPAGPPLTCGGEMVRWIQEVHVVKSSGATPNPTFTATLAENPAVSHL